MEQGNVPIAAPAIDIIDPSRAMAVITHPERVINSFKNPGREFSVTCIRDESPSSR